MNGWFKGHRQLLLAVPFFPYGGLVLLDLVSSGAYALAESRMRLVGSCRSP